MSGYPIFSGDSLSRTTRVSRVARRVHHIVTLVQLIHLREYGAIVSAWALLYRHGMDRRVDAF